MRNHRPNKGKADKKIRHANYKEPKHADSYERDMHQTKALSRWRDLKTENNNELEVDESIDEKTGIQKIPHVLSVRVNAPRQQLERVSKALRHGQLTRSQVIVTLFLCLRTRGFSRGMLNTK
jgi:DUF438 domain-containing protein